MKTPLLSRRAFLNQTLALAAGTPLALLAASAVAPTTAKVAIVPCRSYGAEVQGALDKCFDLLGGIGSLVKNKTVTVKLNLTGTNFKPFLDRPVGETFMTHYSTALALARALFAAGATRVR